MQSHQDFLDSNAKRTVKHNGKTLFPTESVNQKPKLKQETAKDGMAGLQSGNKI